MASETKETSKTSLGIDEKGAAALCYLLGYITGIIFLVLEKKSAFVRFHAIQSIATFAALTVVSMVGMVIPFIGVIISILVPIIAFILWIVLMYKAYQGEKYKLPIVGDFAEKQVG